MSLRSIYNVPFYSECLTDEIKHGGERRMADQVDRDFELISYNMHPTQLYAYNLKNEALANLKQAQEYTQANNGVSLEDECLQFFD